MENMRLRADPFSRPYVKYLLKVDNGQESSIIDHFPLEVDAKPLVTVKLTLYPKIHQAPFLDTLIHAVFLTLAINYSNQGYMDGRTILTTKNIIVNSFNTDVTKAVLGREHVFLSANSVEMGDNQAMAIGTKFFNTITLSGMPPHRLALKVGVPVMLLRNLDAASGLCNGTHLIIWCLAQRLIVVQIIGGMHAKNIVNISRITMTTNRSKWPFTLQRRKFPLQLAFTMTVNKAQGQTMKIVGIYLPEPVFTHGQLYVVLSRATHLNDISVFCPNGRTMTYVVYTKLLRSSFFSIYCLLFSRDGSKFPHPNHGLKFPTLDAKMATTEATFTTCSC
jgi:ATP-dependent DNA helicase PIF1